MTIYTKPFITLDGNQHLINGTTAQIFPYGHYTCHLCGSALVFHPEWGTNCPWFEHTLERLTEDGHDNYPYVHAAGSGYFEYDLEDADERRLTHCEYQIIAQDKPVSTFDQALTALMVRDDTPSTDPSKKGYFCVLCQREYYGIRCCPHSGQHIYSTEMKDRELLTIPVKFAK